MKLLIGFLLMRGTKEIMEFFLKIWMRMKSFEELKGKFENKD
jgi:hypothetical protein